MNPTFPSLLSSSSQSAPHVLLIHIPSPYTHCMTQTAPDLYIFSPGVPSPFTPFIPSPPLHQVSHSDLSAGVVWAWDADDEEEGTNAILTYSIDKNVVDERSGEAIFDIDPKTGLVRTAICCLDRETTPEYHIQVVATDGGGLKGKAGEGRRARRA